MGLNHYHYRQCFAGVYQRNIYEWRIRIVSVHRAVLPEIALMLTLRDFYLFRSGMGGPVPPACLPGDVYGRGPPTGGPGDWLRLPR